MPKNNKLIIGLIGEAGSGKDTVGDYLQKKYKAVHYRYHEPLKEALEIFLGPGNVSRNDLIWLSNNIRARYGNQIISRALKKRIDRIRNGIVVLNGLRIAEDVEFVRSLPDSFIFYVTLDQKKRWERIYGRGERNDDALSFEKFRKYEKAKTEVQIPKIGKKADFRLKNRGTKEELFAKVDEIIERIRK
jgi:dephospho-CoA kinase